MSSTSIDSISKLVDQQREYFNSGAPSALKHRVEQLKKLRNVLISEEHTLCEAICKDLRRKPKVTSVIELSSIITEIDYMVDNIYEWTAPTNAQKTFVTVLDKPQVVRQPKGVVLIIGPWNYPINTLILPLVDVIAAGNTAILKPSEIAGHTAKAVDYVISKAFDKNFLAVVQGGMEETSELLKQRFDHIMFTGSSGIGKEILKAAAENLTPCTLELGGKCPSIVEADADIEITARRIAWGKFLNCGQTCIAPDYVMVEASVKTQFIDALIQSIHNFYTKNIQQCPDFSRIINSKHFDRLENLLKETNGQILFEGGEKNRDDLFIPPTLLDVTPDDAIMTTEIFGPILPIITIDSFEDAVSIVKKGERPLAAYVFTRDECKVQRLLKETHSGAVAINDVIMQYTVDTIPFGGIGHSGMGRYHGKYGFDEFTHEKAVLFRGFFADGLTAARYPPLTDAKLNQLKQLTGTRRAIPRWLKAVFSSLPLVIFGVLLGWFANRFTGSPSNRQTY